MEIAKGEAGEEWHGVRNYQARNNMRAMKLGDRGFISLTGEYFDDGQTSRGETRPIAAAMKSQC